MKASQEVDQKRMIRLVREVIGGKPLNQVPVDLIPKLREALDTSKSELISKGEVERLKKVQALITEIDRDKKKPRSERSLQKAQAKSESSLPHDEIPPESVIQSVFSDLLDGLPYDVAETYLLPHLISYAKSTINALISNGNYSEAQKYENVLKNLVALVPERAQSEARVSKVDNLQRQLQASTSSLDDAERNYKLAIDTFNEKVDLEKRAAEDEWTEQLKEFDSITDGPLPPAFRKFSQSLLNIRETEKNLVLSRRFDEAASMKAEADKLEEREVKQLEKKFVQARLLQKDNLVDQHKHKMQCMALKNERALVKLKGEFENEISNLRKTVEILKSRLDEADHQTSQTKETAAPKPTTFVTQATPRLLTPKGNHLRATALQRKTADAAKKKKAA